MCVPGSEEYENQSCLAEVHVTCKSGDVTVSVSEILGAYNETGGALPTQYINGTKYYKCAEGTTIYVDFSAEVYNNANSERFDVGVWWNIGQDSALTGDNCTVTSFNTTNLKDKELAGEEDPCGDLEGKETAQADVCKLAIVCSDPSSTTESETVTVPSCTTYKQPGANEICNETVSTYSGLNNESFGVLPGNPSKCECEFTNFPILIERCALSVTFPLDTSVECGEDPKNLTLTGTPTATSNLGDVTSDYTDTASGTCPTVITRTWNVSDTCGNSASHIQIINVTDTTQPSFADFPQDAIVECDESTDPSNTGGNATATDNCDSDVDITYSDEQTLGACVANYSITRTWTATDDCGNTRSKNQTIIVQDTTAPNITVPDDTTVECDESTDPSNTGGNATATDNCDNDVSITYSDVTTPGACGGNYSITRTWTATDDCGNSVSKNQTITVQDTTPPTITCPSHDCLNNFCANFAYVHKNESSVQSSDNCKGTVSIQKPYCGSESTDNGIVTTTTWTATDECGNSNSCNHTLTLNAVDTCPL